MKNQHEMWCALPAGTREFATKMATEAVLGAATVGLYNLMGTAQAQQPQKAPEPPQEGWAKRQQHRGHCYHQCQWKGGR